MKGTYTIADWKKLTGRQRRKLADARIEAKRASGLPPPDYHSLAAEEWRNLPADVQRLVWRRTLELRDLTALKLGHPFKGALDDDAAWRAADSELAPRLARVARYRPLYRPFDDFCRAQFGQGLLASLQRWTALEQQLAHDPVAASIQIVAHAGVDTGRFFAAAQARLAQHDDGGARVEAQPVASVTCQEILDAAH
jgi:hypothetical protein